MTLPLPPGITVAGWLHTLGVASRCQWDVLLFLAHHQTTLLGAETLARLLGYGTAVLMEALDALEALDLVERSRVSHGARLYTCTAPCVAPSHEPLAQLQALASHRTGRVLIARQFPRENHPPAAARRAARSVRWLKAL
jgi:DNA-binding FadR family transcriptional regulator